MDAALTKEGNTLGATLLITGCCIGAGMIGLPVLSAMADFMPSTLAMLLCYFFATGTGLLILEATLWFDQKVNLISMAGFALGKAGKAITWTLFLFLFYCLFVAYMDGGGQLFSNMLSTLFSYPVAREIGIICCVTFVGLIVYGGTKTVSYMSRLFLCGLAFSFCVLLCLGIPHVKEEKLLFANWKAIYSTIPILLVCFGYQNLIPTLTYYVRKNVAAIRTAIFAGNLIPFLVYGLVLVPPMLLTIFFPHLFLKALGAAGGFADVLLFGVLPVMIVGIGRYVKKIKGPFTAPGGKLFLIVILLFSAGFLLIRS